MSVGELNINSYSSVNALWHLNGNSTDSTANANNGTDTNITYPTGKFNQGGLFNGSSSKIVLTTSSSLKPTGNFTVGLWFKTTTTGLDKKLFGSYSQNTAVAGIQLAINSGNQLFVISGKNSGVSQGTDFQLATTTATVTDGLWKLGIGVYDGTNIMIYLNGDLAQSVSWANNPAYAATSYQRIGCDNVSGTDQQFFNGYIDEVFLLGTALTPIQIKNYYAWAKGLRTSIA